MVVINLLFLTSLSLQARSLTAVGTYMCSSSDQSMIGATFGSDYWNCIQSTSLSYQIESCIRSQYPGVLDKISSRCHNCISNVFLLTGASCILSCRAQSDSPECNACRSDVASHWQTCVPKSVGSVQPSQLLLAVIFLALFML